MMERFGGYEDQQRAFGKKPTPPAALLLTDEEINNVWRTMSAENKMKSGLDWDRLLAQAQLAHCQPLIEQAVRKEIGEKIIEIVNDGDIYFTKLVAIETYANGLSGKQPEQGGKG